MGESEPAATGAGAAKAPHASTDEGKLRVFISYSRTDLAFTDQLEAALTACDFDCALDRHDIPGGERWNDRVRVLISDSDTVVFVLTPASAVSGICALEVDESIRLGKRIIPVVSGPLGDVKPPDRLSALNYTPDHPLPPPPPAANSRDSRDYGPGQSYRRHRRRLNPMVEQLVRTRSDPPMISRRVLAARTPVLPDGLWQRSRHCEERSFRAPYGSSQ